MLEGQCDVVVVGCGPAGLVAGALLARAGRRVVAVDGLEEPDDGLLVLTEPARAVLSDMGWLRALVDVPGARSSRGLRLVGRNAELDVDPAWESLTVPRRRALEVLADRASAEGLDIVRGLAATVPVWQERRVTGVRVRDREGRESGIDARCVVDASGAAARIVTALGQLLPHRSGPRVRVMAEASGGVAEVHRLGIASGQWIQLVPGEPAVMSAVLRVSDDVVQGAWSDLLRERVESLAGGWPVPAGSVTVAGRVGPTVRNPAGEGWVAVGEAAGSGSPGSPGTLATGLGTASTAAWEIDLALEHGRAVTAGQLGATLTLGRQAVFLEALLDRVLTRASDAGSFAEAVGGRRRRQALSGLLAGDWRRRRWRAWQVLFLWWLDRRSGRAARLAGVPRRTTYEDRLQ